MSNPAGPIVEIEQERSGMETASEIWEDSKYITLE